MSVETQVKPRRAWIAAILAFIGGPTGHLYAGRPARAACVLAGIYFLPTIALAVLLHLSSNVVSIALLVSIYVGFSVWYIADAAIVAKSQRPQQLAWYQRWWIYIGVIVLFHLGYPEIFNLTRNYLAEAFTVPGRHMSDTLIPGDRLIVDNFEYRFWPVRHGHVISYYDYDNEVVQVQRVIGLPGDVIEIRDGIVQRNGERLDEPYAKHLGTVRDPRFVEYGPETVPDDHLFVMGDHRRVSYDSRMRGFVPIEDVVGRAKVIYWSRVPRKVEIDEFSSEDQASGTRWHRRGQRIR